jgi:hypothetical protein
MSERRLQNTIGGWFNRVQERVPESFDHTDLLFAFRRLWKSGYLYLTKLDGNQYSGNPKDDSWFFLDKEFQVAVTPEG